MGKKLTFEFVQNYFRAKGCELLSTEYINGTLPLKYKCKCGNNTQKIFNKFKQHSTCENCRIKEHIRYTYNDVKEYILEQGYILLDTEYKNCNTNLNIKCPKDHMLHINFIRFKGGQRCSFCNNSYF